VVLAPAQDEDEQSDDSEDDEYRCKHGPSVPLLSGVETNVVWRVGHARQTTIPV
jgi:hypothetical protein